MLIIILFMVAMEKFAPWERYEITIVLVIIAGNAENIPPQIGPPILLIKTLKLITDPLNKPRNKIVMEEYFIFLPGSDFTFTIFSINTKDTVNKTK